MDIDRVSCQVRSTRTHLLRAAINSSPWKRGSTIKLLILGITGAGKTTMIDFLQSGTVNPKKRVPTLAFTPHKLDFGQIKLIFVDVPGQEAYWDQWKRYIQAADGILFVVDSTNPSLIPTVHRVLRKVVSSDNRGIPIGFVINKRDLPNSLSSESFEMLLNFQSLHKINRKVSAFDSSAITGRGLINAVQWVIYASYN